MNKLGLNTRNKRRFRIMTTDYNHSCTLAPNKLKQDFYATRTNEKFVVGITYIPTKKGWLYLAVVIDLFSRKIVGWSMSSNMKTSLVNDALLMASQSHQPRTGLIWYTDRGSQYASDKHKKSLKKHGIVQSMSRRGNCYDNAVAESFFHSLKTELTHHIKFETRSQANQAIFEYIEIFYNRKRLPSFNCLVPESHGFSYNFLKGVDLWEIYNTLMPRQHHESEKRYKSLVRQSQS